MFPPKWCLGKEKDASGLQQVTLSWWLSILLPSSLFGWAATSLALLLLALSLPDPSKFILFLQLHLTQEGQGQLLLLCHKDKTSFEFLFAGTCTSNKQHRLSIQDRSIVFPMVYRLGWRGEQTNASWLWLSCLYSILKVAGRSCRKMCAVLQSCLTHSRVISHPHTHLHSPPSSLLLQIRKLTLKM